jgi:hypothetical protein
MSSSTGPTEFERLRSEKNRFIQSGYNKGTIRSDMRSLVVPMGGRRHRLISNDYMTALPVTAEVAVRVSSSPPFPFKHLQKILYPSVGTKRDQKGMTSTRPGTAVSLHSIAIPGSATPNTSDLLGCLASLLAQKSETTAVCAARFSVVTAWVYASSVTRIVECRISSCMTLSSAPVARSSVEYVRRKVCHPMRRGSEFESRRLRHSLQKSCPDFSETKEGAKGCNFAPFLHPVLSIRAVFSCAALTI